MYRSRGSQAVLALAASLAVVTLGSASGCSSSSDGPPATTVGAGTDAGTTVAAGTPFKISELTGCGSAGTQTVAAVAGSKIGFASLAATASTSACTTMNGTSQVQVWDVCFALSTTPGKYTTYKVTSQPYLDPTGVGLAFDAAGQATVAYTGVAPGGPAKLRCGANALYYATGMESATGTLAQTLVAQGSASAGVVPDQAVNCAAQNVCNQGDATGYWPALAFDPSNNANVAFRDIHYGFATDDFASSDVEYDKAPANSMLTIDVARGGGTYARMAIKPDGLPAVAHYSKDKNPSVWTNIQSASGWAAQAVSVGEIGEQLGFAVSAKGVFALAFYDTAKQKLQYMESQDGVAWSSPINVDLDGSTGFQPSLAFDAAGDPAIAYYKCNAQGPNQSNCDASHDGLHLARRKSGTWQAKEIKNDASQKDGLYPALAFVNGKAAIAYQASTFDPVSTKNTVTWWVAEEP